MNRAAADDNVLLLLQLAVLPLATPPIPYSVVAMPSDQRIKNAGGAGC